MGIRIRKVGPEEQLLQQVIRYATLTGWLIHHTRAARTKKGWRTPIQGHAGFPDLVMTRKGRIIFAELKVGQRQPAPMQQLWMECLAQAEVEVYLWKPADWSEIEEALR